MKNNQGRTHKEMKLVHAQVRILGEKFLFSGDPVILSQTFGLCSKYLERVQREHRGEKISRLRLGILAFMALSAKMVHLQDQQKKVQSRRENHCPDKRPLARIR